MIVHNSPATHPEMFVDLAIKELISVAQQEGLLLSNIFQQLKQKHLFTEPAFRSDLVAAETAKKAKCYLEAINLYDSAIVKARESQSIEAEALSNEMAAKFHLEWGKKKFAAIYLQEALTHYQNWGSQVKIEALRLRYSSMLELAPPEDPQVSSFNGFKNEFIATLSYEFRTPLNCILGMTEALQEEVFGHMNERQLNAVSTIERSSGQLSEILNDIRDLANIQSGDLELEIADVSILDLCQSSLSSVKHHAIRKQIQLNIDIRVTAGNIAIDRNHIHKVLVSLLNHAIDFTPVGGTVTLVAEQDSVIDSINLQAWVKFSVVDTSKVAFPTTNQWSSQDSRLPMDRDRDNILRRQYSKSSTGLGLLLVKPIIDLHKGYVSFQSAIGKGGCTSLHLPCSLSLGEDTATQITSLADLAEMSGNLVLDEYISPLILIAEDNELNTDTISSYLIAKGYRTIWAGNGAEAVKLASQEQPDLILMDIQMPNMDGITAIRQLRSIPSLVNLPIIALTALAMVGDRERCLVAGATEYLSKPVKLKQLATLIENLLSAKTEYAERYSRN